MIESRQNEFDGTLTAASELGGSSSFIEENTSEPLVWLTPQAGIVPIRASAPDWELTQRPVSQPEVGETTAWQPPAMVFDEQINSPTFDFGPSVPPLTSKGAVDQLIQRNQHGVVMDADLVFVLDETCLTPTIRDLCNAEYGDRVRDYYGDSMPIVGEVGGTASWLDGNELPSSNAWNDDGRDSSDSWSFDGP